MASWKALGWILEAPELDFRASRPRFWSLQPRFWSLQARLWSLQASNLPLLMLPTFSNTTWQTWDSLLPGVHSFCVFAFLNSLAKVWEAAVSPLGGLQSAAHRRCAKRARSPAPSLSDTLDPSQLANLKGQAHYAGLGSWSPLFVSPQQGGDHRNPEAKIHHLRLVGPLGSIFCPSQACFKNDFEKTSKKVWKSRILTSQNPLKIYPKSLQNRYPKKHTIFKRIFDNIFQNSKPRNLENINFASTGARFLRFSLKSCFCYFQAFWIKKTYQKPFQNEVRTP